jgi:hypothetical protein
MRERGLLPIDKPLFINDLPRGPQLHEGAAGIVACYPAWRLWFFDTAAIVIVSAETGRPGNSAHQRDVAS